MIVCCHTQIDRQWSDAELQQKLNLLPQKMQQDALRKRLWLDKQLAISGKLLLMEVLKHFDPGLLLKDIQYNQYHRPYFNADFDFNIAHSGNIAICCGTIEGKVGVDIEQGKEIDLSDYADYFTTNEWNLINNSTDKFDAFYNCWARKEAVLKAIGTGFHTPLLAVNVSEDVVRYDGVAYYLQELNIQTEYKCNIASTMKQSISLYPVVI